MLSRPDDRRDQPAINRDRHGDIGVMEQACVVTLPGGVRLRHLDQRHRGRADHQIIHRNLNIIRRLFVHHLARREERVDLAIHRQIEMRGVGFRFLQTLGDDLAHLAVRLEAARPRRGRSACRRHCRRYPSSHRRRGCRRRGRHGRLDIAAQDPAMRPASRQAGKIDIVVAGDAAGERTGEQARRVTACPGRGSGHRTRCRNYCRSRNNWCWGSWCRTLDLCLGNRRRRRGGNGCRGHIINGLAIFGQTRDRRADGHILAACLDEDDGQNTVIDSLDLHGRLVGLDLGNHIAASHRVADRDIPCGECARLHGRGQGRHQNFDSHL